MSETALHPYRVGVDTHQEPVAYLRADSSVARSEGFGAMMRVQLDCGERRVIATLNLVHDGWLPAETVGLSEAAWLALLPADGDRIRVRHAPPVESMRAVRGKVYGRELSHAEFEDIMGDLVGGRLSDVEIAAFITGCAGERLSLNEVVGLTRAMVGVGDRMRWDAEVVVDKHCVGGLPGNRTTPIVVALMAAAGLTMPKTSSRAITSPAGTADTMETLALVDLSIPAMRRVVEREGGCVVWGGAVHLSPADDVLIRIERALDLDSEGQLVASVLSKKIAAGSTHVVLDLPMGPTAKVRSQDAADHLSHLLQEVGRRFGLALRTLVTDGSQPVGRGVGPALEALDVLAVLQGAADAPVDLRTRSIALAGELLELAGRASPGGGRSVATQLLDTGAAWRKFQAICTAQGGLRTPPVAPLTRAVLATHAGRVLSIDNRRLSRIAKLAGAPAAKAAGLVIAARVGDRVERGQPLFTVHAETPGELAYAFDHLTESAPAYLVQEETA
jgi:thymidine phosphorylase